jgi:PAS domain S-box-containing protein
MRMPGRPEHVPVRGDGTHRTGLRLSRGATLVLVSMTAASLLLWFATWRLVESQEEETFQHRTDQVRDGFVGRLGSVLNTLSTVGTTMAADPDPATAGNNLQSVLRPAMLTNLALVDTTSAPYQVVAGAGGPEAGQPLGPEAAAAVAQLTPETRLVTTGVIGSGNSRRIGVAQGPPLAPPGRALYGEMPVRASDPATGRVVLGDPAEIDSALYAGATPAPDSLLFATTEAVPFDGEVASRVVPVGTSSWLLQTHARESLVGPLGRTLPWITLVGGLLATGLMTVVVEMGTRRRDDALAFAAETAEESTSILDAAQEAFLVVDQKGIIVRWSAPAELLFGWSAEEAIGMSVLDSLVPVDQREVARTTLVSPAGGPLMGPVRFEGELQDRAGRVFPMEICVWRSPRDPKLLSAILHDISERRRAADQLAKAHEDALAASRLKSEFVATMSHEIRTPMNAVIGMTSLLLRTSLDEDQREYAETVSTSAEALLTLVNDVLDFSKIEAGKLEIARLDFDVRATVAEVVDLLVEQARAKDLELVTVTRPDVPALVHGDPGRLRQILVNLAGNAVKFTADGGVTITCSVDSAGPGPGDPLRLRFEVQDTGCGIAADQLEHVFTSFTQADSSTTRRYGGTGLGLTIARQLTELMGGQIGATSEVGAGSTFWFTVELTRVEGAPATRRPVPEATVAMGEDERSVPSGTRVLVAEDNAVNQRVAVRMLERIGCTVDVVANGEEAVAAAMAGEHRLILMDCQMPVMDGYEAAGEIRRREAPGTRIPIIAMTAAAMTGDRERTLEAGMDDYIAKPVRIADLTAAVLRWVPDDQSPPTLTVGATSPIDLAAVEDLRALVSSADGGLSSLTAELTIGAVDQLREMEAASVRGDLELVARTAHYLRGTTSTFGAAEASADAEAVERAARAGDVAGVTVALERLTGSVERAAEAMTRLVGPAT